jgi:predicted AAA+ superfamily ATPase
MLLAPRLLAQANDAVATAAGYLVESVIGYYLRGIPGADLSWFPARHQEPEIDFVLTIGLKRIPVEVKYRRSAPTSGDGVGLQSFCSQPKYNAPFGLLVTQDASGPFGPNVLALPAYALLSLC